MNDILKILAGWLTNINLSLPYVKQSVMQVTSLDCLFNVIFGFLVLAVSSLLLFCSYKAAMFVLGIERSNKDKTYHERTPKETGAHETQFWFCGIPGVILLFVSLVYLLDFWSWVGINHPDLYLVHKAVSMVVH